MKLTNKALAKDMFIRAHKIYDQADAIDISDPNAGLAVKLLGEKNNALKQINNRFKQALVHDIHVATTKGYASSFMEEE